MLPMTTATIVWFPPTGTPTPAPSAAPTATPVELPGVTDVLFSDDFSDPSHWQISSSDQGAAIIEGNRLTLAVRAPNATVITFRDEPLLGNFYAEVTASTALCAGKDDYGVLFRTASGNDYYRYALSCDGTERVDRVRSGQTSFMQPAVPSGDAPPGSPGEVRIGVWAVDNEFRFFLNGRYQFTVYDPLFKTGTLGFFAGAGGDNAVSISFSDLVVSQVVYASPTVNANRLQDTDAYAHPAPNSLTFEKINKMPNKLNDLDSKTWLKFQKSWFIHNPPPRKKGVLRHPAKFPETMAQEFIEFFTKKGGTVLDPMAGTGSTLVAALRCGRNSFGIELNPKYAEIARQVIDEERQLLGSSIENLKSEIIQATPVSQRLMGFRRSITSSPPRPIGTCCARRVPGRRRNAVPHLSWMCSTRTTLKTWATSMTMTQFVAKSGCDLYRAQTAPA